MKGVVVFLALILALSFVVANVPAGFGGYETPTLTSIQPSIVSSRISGTEPLVAHFSAQDTTCTGCTNPYDQLEYGWDFGDSSGQIIITNPVTGSTENMNTDQRGPEAAYIFRNPGTYTVTLTVRGWNGFQYITSSTTKQINVNTFNGSEVYIDPVSGNDANPGTLAQPKQSWTAFKTAASTSNTKVHLKRGTILDATDVLMIGTSNNVRVVPYGTGVAPKINGTSSSGYLVRFFGNDDTYIINHVWEGLDLENYEKVIGSYAHGGTVNQPIPGVVKEIVFIDTKITTHVGGPVSYSGAWFESMSFWNSEFVHNQGDGQGIFAGGDGRWFAVIGGRFVGGNGREIYDHHIYPSGWNNSVYRSIDFDDAIMKNFCINLNAGQNDSYVLLDSIDCYGTMNSLDIGSNGNNNQEKLLTNVIIQNSAFHDTGRIGSQGLAFWASSLRRVTIRDNIFYNIKRGITAGSSAVLDFNFYRNKLYQPETAGQSRMFGFSTGDKGLFTDNIIVYERASEGDIFNLPDSEIPKWTIDRNQYYFPNITNPFQGSSGDISFSEWRALGFDANGFVQDPQWNDPLNGDFSSAALPQCSDGTDNDGDGLIDWQYDLGCYGPNDPTEGGKNNELDNGWTVYEPHSTDTRIVYVSSSSGNDLNDGLSPGTAKKTILAGSTLIRDQSSDWLLLKRGDTWVDESLVASPVRDIWGRDKVGKSSTHPIIIASYGDSTSRPLLKTGSLEGITAWNMKNFALMGIEFYANTRDPASPDYVANPPGIRGITFQYANENITIEDCKMDFYENNVMQSAGADPKNIMIRRNVFSNSYSVDSHSQGLYTESTINMTLEENAFVHTGWLIQGNGDNNQSGGAATIFNHNIYVSKGIDTLIKGNLFLQASSIATKLRSDVQSGHKGLTVENNYYSEGEIGISLGSKNPDVQYCFEDVILKNNVMNGIGRTAPTSRGLAWGIGIGSVENILIENNLIKDQNDYQNSYGMQISSNPIKDATIRNNLIYNSRGHGIRSINSPFWQNILVENNEIDDSFNDQYLIDHTGSFLGITFNNNNYYSHNPADEWFRIDRNERDLAFWKNVSGETNAQGNPVSYPDPSRDMATYMASLGETASFAEFKNKVLSQSKYNWRSEYTACAANNYIRSGFGKAPINCQVTVTQSYCGDSTCSAGETCSTCERDCGVCSGSGPICGDGNCNGAETCSSCETDCGKCSTNEGSSSGGGSSGGSGSTLTTPTNLQTNPLTGSQKFFLSGKTYRFETRNRFIKEILLRIAKDADQGSIELSEKSEVSIPVTRGKTLQAFEIRPTLGLSDKAVIDSGEVIFSVPEFWVEDNFIDRSEGVKLARLKDSWEYYDSEFIKQEDTNLIYEAEVLGFSEFVIVGLTKRELMVQAKNQRIISMAGLSIALIIVGSGIAIIIIFLQVDAVRRRKKKALEQVKRSRELIGEYVGRIGE